MFRQGSFVSVSLEILVLADDSHYMVKCSPRSRSDPVSEKEINGQADECLCYEATEIA